jgi:hypothetical protein
MAAPAFTALLSDDRFAPGEEDDEPPLAAADAVPAAEAGDVPELLDDEQAASSTAPPAASTPNATRTFRGFRLLLILKLSMRPRILIIQGRPDHIAHRVVLAPLDCQRACQQDRVSFRLL